MVWLYPTQLCTLPWLYLALYQPYITMTLFVSASLYHVLRWLYLLTIALILTARTSLYTLVYVPSFHFTMSYVIMVLYLFLYPHDCSTSLLLRWDYLESQIGLIPLMNNWWSGDTFPWWQLESTKRCVPLMWPAVLCSGLAALSCDWPAWASQKRDSGKKNAFKVLPDTQTGVHV